ncbi:hypothetical protein ACIBEA_42440 [Streptomyces sp. NPDC051555]|uniref:terpene synthase family protein n=1 Tax=Streptomyces sp. NPDC051555 TaxID=3365657 RepID=UPI0037998826
MFPIENFFLPGPELMNPHRDEIFTDNLRWMSASGLLDPSTATRYCRSYVIADCASWIWPLGRYPDVVDGANLIGWFFLHEEQFDGPAGSDPERTREAVGDLIALIQGRRPEHPSVSTRAFAQLLASFNEGMSDGWKARHAEHWLRFFTAYIVEARYRSTGAWPTVEEFTTLRRDSIGNAVMFDLIERFGHFETPAQIQDSAVFHEMITAALDATMLQNDLVSARREAEADDTHNTVLVQAHQHGQTLEEAGHTVLNRCNTRARDFLRAAAALRTTYHYLDLNPVQREAAEKFVTGLAHWLRGHLDWHLATNRYSQPAQSYTTHHEPPGAPQP